MANNGKFIDRSPRICTAGIQSLLVESVGSLLKWYPIADDINALKRACNITDIEKIKYPVEPSINNRNCGYYSKVRELVSPPSKTAFQEVAIETFEKRYESVKNRPLGQPRKALHKPDCVTNLSHTFGIPSIKEDPVYETILPNKSPNLILCESQIGHSNYIKSHGSYNASEQVKRPYCPECFDINKTYGIRYAVDNSGKKVKQCMKSTYYPSTICVINKIHGDYRGKTCAALGKPLEPNQNKYCLPEDHKYGRKNQVYKHGVKELLRDCEPCDNINKLYDSISHINTIRRVLHRREELNFNDLMMFVASFDKDNKKLLPKEQLFLILANQYIILNQKKIEFLLKFFNMMTVDGLISYIDLIKLLDKRIEFPSLGKIQDVPTVNQYYITTYQDALMNHFCNPVDPLTRTAGVPSLRTDKLYPLMPEKGITAYIPMLGDETTAETLISPSIPVTYGVSHRDYFYPRTKEEIHCLFSNVGYDLSSEEFFNSVYKKCLEIDQHPDNLVCVNTFKEVLKQSLVDN